MNSKNYSVNSLSTLGALPPEVLTFDLVQFANLSPGYLLGEFKNYRLLEHLGEGGMGQTWLAEELAGGEAVQKVVVKVLSKEFCGHAEALAEVRRIFELTGKLRHSNICATFGMKKDPLFGWFLVMDHADGGTLSDWFKCQPNHEKGLPLEKILPILRPIAEALDYAHREGVLHRDVKPQNIMFSRGKPVLIDFGIAARIRPEKVPEISQTQGDSSTPNASSTQHASSTSGTPLYMAPEQFLAQPQTGRTDQYAFAMVLYELLTGKLPFTGKSTAALGIEKARFTPQTAAFSASANAAFIRALSFEAKDRFPTCTEFLDALADTGFPAVSQKVSSVFPNVSTQEKPHEKTNPQTCVKLNTETEKSSGEPFQPFWKGENLSQERFEKDAAELSSSGSEKAEISPPLPRRNFMLGGAAVLGGISLFGGWGLWTFGNSLSTSLRDYSPAPADFSEKARVGEVPDGTRPGERKVWCVDGIHFPFRWCPAGTFMMGSPADEHGRAENETQHKVTLTRGFWILETEVTQAMWEFAACRNLSKFKEKRHPVDCASWDRCQSFCAKLSSKLGAVVSLPTEAQWEYACRAGTTGAYAGSLSAMAWYSRGSSGQTHPVGAKKANAWGLHDMHGNVFEWCSDRYAPYGAHTVTDPQGPEGGSLRILRGGGWKNGAEQCRSAFRYYAMPDDGIGCGLRVVLAPSRE